jgi:hypothetical protein
MIPRDFATSFYFVSHKPAYIDSVRSGDLDILKLYFAAQSILSANNCTIPWDDDLFKFVCQHGHLHILQWLIEVRESERQGVKNMLQLTAENFIEAIQSDNVVFVQLLEQIYVDHNRFFSEKIDQIALVSGLLLKEHKECPERNPMVQYMLSKPELYLTESTRNTMSVWHSNICADASEQVIQFLYEKFDMVPTVETISSMIASRRGKMEIESKLVFLWEFVKDKQIDTETINMWLFQTLTTGRVQVLKFLLRKCFIGSNDQLQSCVEDLMRSFPERIYSHSVYEGVDILDYLLNKNVQVDLQKLLDLMGEHEDILLAVESYVNDYIFSMMRSFLELSYDPKHRRINTTVFGSLHLSTEQLEDTMEWVIENIEEILCDGNLVIKDIVRYYVCLYL